MADAVLCSVTGCSKDAHRRGFCSMHYAKLLRRGDPLAGRTRKHSEGTGQRWLRAHKDYDGQPCLIWPFGETRGGYRSVTINGKPTSAHRFMCELAHGPAPEDRPFAIHSCGNGHLACVHPKHLRWATPAENSADAVAHGVVGPGEMNGSAKLTNDDVRTIRTLRGVETGVILAARFGVAAAQISNIQLRKQWAHIE